MRPSAVLPSLSDRVARWFPSQSRARGADAFQARRVNLRRADSDFVEAWVHGDGLAVVEVLVDGSTLGVRCNCSPFVDDEVYCEHLWATLLAAESIERLAVPRGPLELDDLVDEVAPSPSRQEAKEARAPLPPVSWREVAAKHAPIADPRTLAPLRREHRREARCIVRYEPSRAGGAIVVAFEQRSITPRGLVREWRSVSLSQAAACATPEEAPGYELLEGCKIVSRTYGEPASVAVPLPIAVNVCALLARSGRAEMERYDGSRVSLVVDARGPWRFVLTVREDGDALAVGGAWARGDERLDFLATSSLVFTSDVALLRDRMIAIERIAGYEWVQAILPRGQAVRVPAEDRADFYAFAAARGNVELPSGVGFAESREPPRFLARFAKPDVDAARVRARPFATYGSWEIPLGAPGRAIVDAAEKLVHVRDVGAERAAVDAIASLGARAAGDGGEIDLPIARLPAATRSLLGWGWRVEGAGRRYRSPTATRATVRSGVDWFELRADIDFDGEVVSLPRLLAAAHRGESFVELGDGSLGVLPEDWLHRWGALAELGAQKGEDAVRFSRSQATLLDALVETIPDRTLDDAFARLRERLTTGFVPSTNPTIPADFTGELRDYQRAGVAWMELLAEAGFGGCLADDMGLGKTVQVLARLAARRGQGPSLVVAPRSLVFNWRDEAARFVPSLRVLDYTGAARRLARSRLAQHDLVLTTYGTLRRDAEALAEVEFDYVILDEAQAVKNEASEAAKAARGLRGRHRLALSGTPIENHLGELWSLFEFLNPRMLGRSSAFKRWSTTRALDAEDRALLGRAIRPFVLRRTKGEVARELPERVEQTTMCELEGDQRALYDELRRHYRRTLLTAAKKQGTNAPTMNVLEALLRLRQAACHPVLVDPARRDAPSAKLEALFEQLESVLDEGSKAIVFSQFTSLLALVAARLRANKVDFEELDGSTRKRERPVARFQEDPACKVFLVSLKAGGSGLNLTAASYVFLLDPWWNPAAEAQAIDRAHRIGQTKTVFAYRLVAKDTIEERVLALQQAKRQLAEEILGPAGWSVLKDLAVEDLDLLLS